MGMIDVGGFLLSFLSSLRFYSFFGGLLVSNFSLPKGIADALGFVVAGVLTEFILSFLINFLNKHVFNKIEGRLWKNKLFAIFENLNSRLGFIPALFEALIFISFLLLLLLSLPLSGRVKNDIVTSKIGGPLIANAQSVERQLKNIFGEAVNDTLTFFTISPTSSEKVNLHFKQSNLKIDPESEMTMFELVNQERIKAGFKPLVFNDKLRDVARLHAKDMFERGYFSHYTPEGLSPFDRMKNAGIFYTEAGENLAFAPNVNIAHAGLMNSPGHRANILSPDFGKVGIGVIDGGIYGEMFVQKFTD